MDILQIVENGAVTNIISIEPDAVIAADRKTAAWDGGNYTAQAGELWKVKGAQIGWRVSDGTLMPPAAGVVAPGSEGTA